MLKDRKLDKVVAYEGKLKAERFINIINKTTKKLFGISCKAIQKHFELIKDEFKEQGLTELLQREFELDKVKTEMNDRKLGFRVTGQNANIRVIRADVQNGTQGSKSFVFDSVA